MNLRKLKIVSFWRYQKSFWILIKTIRENVTISSIYWPCYLSLDFGDRQKQVSSTRPNHWLTIIIVSSCATIHLTLLDEEGLSNPLLLLSVLCTFHPINFTQFLDFMYPTSTHCQSMYYNTHVSYHDQHMYFNLFLEKILFGFAQLYHSYLNFNISLNFCKLFTI